MTVLENAAYSFKKIRNKKIANIYGRKGKTLKITILFKDEHFPHLIGLDKLKDIENAIYGNRTKAEVHNAILEKELTDELIVKSVHLYRASSGNNYTVNERMKFFPKVIEMFFERNHILYGFFKVKANSMIKADYLLKYTIEKKKADDPTYLYLFIKKISISMKFTCQFHFFLAIANNILMACPRIRYYKVN
ncbi:PBECR4 domain-containing protein [Staphylococcus delphini]|uniref:PBECR4 domain-containing protein n=1 Tax=Staphylococcus delphini TaxID=53344 RepID=UPI00374E94AD